MNTVPEWLLGLFGGVVATLLGFMLTMIWDIRKCRRETDHKDASVLMAGKEEYAANIQALSTNKELLQHELSLENKVITRPLQLLETAFWDLLKLNIPRALVDNIDSLPKIRRVAQSTAMVNELIRSRENYRTYNKALSGYRTTLNIYDALLLEDTNALLRDIESTKCLLGD